MKRLWYYTSGGSWKISLVLLLFAFPSTLVVIREGDLAWSVIGTLTFIILALSIVDRLRRS